MPSAIALTLFILFNIALTLCGGFSIWVFTRVMHHTGSWGKKTVLFFTSWIQILFVVGVWIYLVYLFNHLKGMEAVASRKGVEIYLSTILYCLDVFFLLTLFYTALAIRFYQRVAQAPYRGLKSFGIFVLCLALTFVASWGIISLL